MKQYQVIYADPPWFYSAPLLNKSDGGYSMMKPAELQALDIQAITDPGGALLFLWTTGPRLAEAVALGEAWGFQYITVAFVWDKKAPIYAQYTMPQTEQVLLFRRGPVPKPWGIRNARQFWSQRRTVHSEKPHEIRDTIRDMFPEAKRIELFARHKISGWDRWGNEVPCSVRVKTRSPT